MQELNDETKQLLREFANSPQFEAYKEWMLLEAGKCLGMLRTTRNSPEVDSYTKGVMFGVEKFFLDIIADMVESGNVMTANKHNQDYTKKLLERDMSK